MTVQTLESKTYLDLVREFPPRPIHSAREYQRTLAGMNKLAVRDEDSLTPAEIDYLDALATFIEKFDHERFAEPSSGTAVERLRYIIEQSGMSAPDLGHLLGNRTLGRTLLSGKRELSKSHIRILADHFKLDAGYFL